MDSITAILQWARLIVSSVLVCRYFAMHTEEVWIGFSSVGHFVWATHVFQSSLLHGGCAQLDQTDFVDILHEQEDGLRAPSLLAGTSACILKRSGLVPTVSVISFGLLIHFDPFCCVDAQHSWTKWTALCIRPHGQDGFRASILVCGYFGMYTEGDWIGFSSVSPFVWV